MTIYYVGVPRARSRDVWKESGRDLKRVWAFGVIRTGTIAITFSIPHNQVYVILTMVLQIGL